MIDFDLMYRILPKPHDKVLSVYHLIFISLPKFLRNSPGIFLQMNMIFHWFFGQFDKQFVTNLDMHKAAVPRIYIIQTGFVSTKENF